MISMLSDCSRIYTEGRVPKRFVAATPMNLKVTDKKDFQHLMTKKDLKARIDMKDVTGEDIARDSFRPDDDKNVFMTMCSETAVLTEKGEEVQHRHYSPPSDCQSAKIEHAGYRVLKALNSDSLLESTNSFTN